MLANAGLGTMCQCGEDGGRCVHSSHDICQCYADFHWSATGFAVGVSGEAHQATQTLDQEIIPGARRVWAGLSEAGD